jgi:cytochrome c556
MHFNRFSLICLILFSLVSASFAATIIQERKTKSVTRAKRPTFTERDWDGIYFENLFEEGLVGERPQSITPGNAMMNPDQRTPTADDPTSLTGEFAWSKFISRTTIEDEVKSLQKKLAVDITTPIKFKSDYAKVNQSFSILSMIFAIVRQYDAEVRWKDAGSEAQISFERAAANSRVGTVQAYESCKRRALTLEDMVRGGKFTGEEKPPVDLDWSSVIDRAPLMDRLQESLDQLKKLTANQGDFTREIEVVTHETEMVAAMSAVLAQENMTDADDTGYAEFATEMEKAALAVLQATKGQDYDSASNSVNAISQACDNCHAEWR